jgi:uncharacterized OB-fold protein
MEVPRFWRTQKTRYGLVGNRCSACQEAIFPPRELCPKCGHGESTELRFSGTGEVYSFTTLFHPPEGFTEAVPYVVALVRLAEGPLVSAQLTDVAPDAVRIGMRVEMVTRKLKTDGERGIVVYGYKFRPAVGGSESDPSG